MISGAVADFNGDGHPDLVIAGDGILVLFGAGDGGTFPASTAVGPLLCGVEVPAADVNGDGIVDIVRLTAASRRSRGWFAL